MNIVPQVAAHFLGDSSPYRFDFLSNNRVSVAWNLESRAPYSPFVLDQSAP